jgi:hypothetical protein
MLARVPILRIVTTPHMPAGSAQAQMNPRVAHGKTLLTTSAAGRYGFHLIHMRALLPISCHVDSGKIPNCRIADHSDCHRLVRGSELRRPKAF